MAWISVDQKLIGGKLRSLYKAVGCSQNEAIGILVSLWLWGIDNAEMDGLMVSADRDDIKQSFQVGLAKELDGDVVVDCLIDTGWIDEIDGQLYLHDWGAWRSYYNRYVKDKKGNCERQARYKARQREKTARDEQSNVTNDVIGGVIGTISETKEAEPEKKMSRKEEQEAKHGKDFEEFWEVYPKKVDKGEAFKKYKARRNDGYSAEEILEAAKAYKAECERKHTDKQYIKHAKTFLGPSLSFTEYIPRKQQEPAPSRAQAPAGGIRSL
ncbi:MAG: hypothetical protein HDR09_13085 [Lachnospiraceae bacterium]|nr:hypothetical protein [Lachnospiraceae bacterium]